MKAVAFGRHGRASQRGNAFHERCEVNGLLPGCALLSHLGPGLLQPKQPKEEEPRILFAIPKKGRLAAKVMEMVQVGGCWYPLVKQCALAAVAVQGACLGREYASYSSSALLL